MGVVAGLITWTENLVFSSGGFASQFALKENFLLVSSVRSTFRTQMVLDSLLIVRFGYFPT